MTGHALTTRVTRPVKQMVYVRHLEDGDPIYVGTDHTGWQLDTHLLCDHVQWLAGAKVGHATFRYVPHLGDDQSIETVLERYSVDDQVRVVLLPIEDELVQQPAASATAGQVIFEGLLPRHSAQIKQTSTGATEHVTFTATPMAASDNRLTDQLITGRWCAWYGDGAAPVVMPDGGSYGGELFIVETTALPAVFNHRGQPNRAANRRMYGASGTAADLFTHDDDPTGVWWTLGDALASVLAFWLEGVVGGDERACHIDVSDELLAALALPAYGDDPPTSRPAAYDGLDARLPEVDVQGLGVLDAIERLCMAAGWRMACEPRPAVQLATGQRRYVLDCWRDGAGGDLVWFDVDKRGSIYSDAEDATASNTTPEVKVLRDAAEVVNECTAIGRTFIEAWVPLLPLFGPNDVWPTDTDDVTAELQGKPTVAQLADADGYFGWHYPGGAAYKSNGLRQWGLDTAGQRAGTVQYETWDDWASADVPVTSYDWPGELTGLAAAIASARSGNVSDTSTVHWTDRIRPLMPLRSPAARAAGVPFVLDVKETSSTTWVNCPVRFRTLTDYCGIEITGVPNWANVNMYSLTTGEAIAPTVSWLHSIVNQELNFRILACIEADHAIRYDATRQDTSGSAYARGQVVRVPAEEVWVSPASVFNDTSSWQRHVTHSASGGTTGDPTVSVTDVAKRRRDAGEAVRLAVAASTPRMDLATQYHLGDRVGGVRGRELSFASDGGGEERYPSIVGMAFTLAPAGQQGIAFDLTDGRLRGREDIRGRGRTH